MIKPLWFAGLGWLSSVALTASPYLGASLSYLSDSKKAYPTGRVGMEFSEGAAISHNIEFEVGRFSETQSYGSLRFTPLMVNYRGEMRLSQRVWLYLGAGAGASSVDIEAQVFNSVVGIN